MDDFSERVPPSELPELMDGECNYEDFRACLVSLEQVNRWLGGYRPTLAWLDRTCRKRTTPLTIVDVGCGGGDLLRKIAIWARKRKIDVTLVGIDLNPFAVRAAAAFTPPELNIRWLRGNALQYEAESPVDLIVSSLMTHHLEDEEIIRLLQWMEVNARLGWFINDLERSRRSAQTFRWIAAILRWHEFVLHDGPVSFRRALSKDDWERLIRDAGLQRSKVEVVSWKPGRLCVGTVARC